MISIPRQEMVSMTTPERIFCKINQSLACIKALFGEVGEKIGLNIAIPIA